QAFGATSVFLDVQRHRRREQEAANQALLDMADALGLRAVATNGVRHATAKGRPLLDVLTCIREKKTLATAGRLLSENADRHLKAAKAMEALFADRRDLLGNAEALAERLQFTLADLGYRFPDYPVPEGETLHSYLCAMTEAGARERYRPYHEKARRQIERELLLIGKLELSGYFLIVWDIVNFCRREGILVQGRGSAANSAVCFSLGITAVDPVGMDLLFERFLSEERGEWPDIDLDLPSGDRRERVIQDLPRHLGQHSGGMVIAQGRLDEVVPLEPATMPGRVVIQWDKEDCADLGIIKVDLLGLGMMSAIQDCLATLLETGVEVDLAH